MTDLNLNMMGYLPALCSVHDDSPLAIWRRKTSMEITQSDLTDSRDCLAIFLSCTEPYWADAIAGDVSCAIHIGARSIHPSPVAGLRLDVAMSSLLVCGMSGSTGASFALAALLRYCAFDELVSRDLPLSWLAWAMFPQDTVRAADAMPTLRRLGWPVGRRMSIDFE